MKGSLFVEQKSALGMMLIVIQDRSGLGVFYPMLISLDGLNLLLDGVTTRIKSSMPILPSCENENEIAAGSARQCPARNIPSGQRS